MNAEPNWSVELGFLVLVEVTGELRLRSDWAQSSAS
jgi:hypothetical protein